MEKQKDKSAQDQMPLPEIDMLASGVCLRVSGGVLELVIVQKCEPPFPWVLPGGKGRYQLQEGRYRNGHWQKERSVEETPMEAGRREICEEALFSIGHDDLALLCTLSRRVWKKQKECHRRHGPVFLWHIFAVNGQDRRFELERQTDEVSAPRWVPVSDVLSEYVEGMPKAHTLGTAHALHNLFVALENPEHDIISQLTVLREHSAKNATAFAEVQNLVMETLPWLARRYAL